MAVSILAYQATLPLGLVLLALDRPSINAMGSLAALCVAGTVGVAAVRVMGIEGVGVGLLAAGVTESTIKGIAYRRIYRSRRESEPRVVCTEV